MLQLRQSLLTLLVLNCSDGTTTQGYYIGANGWAPIMGVGEWRHVVVGFCASKKQAVPKEPAATATAAARSGLSDS
jgi:hypothetical protein